jgi:glycosyltransferase involved in cell wall biosynthesis
MLRSRILLKIALVTELFTPSVGGQQTRFEQLALAIAAEGHDVTVICTRNVAEAAPMEVSGGIRILRGPMLPRYEWTAAKRLQRSPIGVLRFAFEARRQLRAGDFDVAYFNQWPYLHVLIAPRKLRRCSGIDWCEFRSGLIHRVFQWILPRRVAFNAAVNEWTGAHIGRGSGVTLHYLPSGVDVAHYRQQPTEARHGLLFLGRLVENKNLPLLLSGYAELRGRGVDEPLTVAGDGPENNSLLAGVRALAPDVREHVNLLGRVDDESKLDLLATSRALLLPSVREGFPNVVAEAIASGLPIATVSSPLNGTASVVQRYGVGAVGLPTPEGFASAVDEVLEHGAELSRRCLDAAVGLDWSVIARELLSLLEGARAGHLQGAAAGV